MPDKELRKGEHKPGNSASQIYREIAKSRNKGKCETIEKQEFYA